MTSTPTISIVIPCYNGAQFLPYSIESVLRQTCPAVEIIVVDDGSSDRTVEVASAYAEVRVISQSHSGVSAARNTGLQVASGHYLVFLDSDDVLLPEALNIGSKELTLHEQCALVYGYCEYIRADGTRLPMPYVPKIKRDFYRHLLKQNFIQISGVMFRRSAVDYFRTDVYGCEDWDLYLRVARKHDIHCHGKIISQYRRHTANMSTSKEKMVSSSLIVLQDQLNFVSGDPSLEKLCRAGIKSLRSELAGKRNVKRDFTNICRFTANRFAGFLD